MKLILANNQSDKFVDFYKDLQKNVSELVDYSSYQDLLFSFDSNSERRLNVINMASEREITDYSGVYINGYLNTYELAAATAVACEKLNVPFVNRELSNPPSLSKLTMYAKLAAAGVNIPNSLAGSENVLLNAEKQIKINLRSRLTQKLNLIPCASGNSVP